MVVDTHEQGCHFIESQAHFWPRSLDDTWKIIFQGSSHEWEDGAGEQYNIAYDLYYKDVQLDGVALSLLHVSSTEILNLLYTSLYPKPIDANLMEINVLDDDIIEDNIHTISSYVANLPLAYREVDQLQSILHLKEGLPTPSIEWPRISVSPINEYNTKRLFVMAFPTLFPTGATSFNQQPLKEVMLHEYALYLLQYYDNRFGQHPRFWYFRLNILQHHQIQATAYVFTNHNIKSGLPTII